MNTNLRLCLRAAPAAALLLLAGCQCCPRRVKLPFLSSDLILFAENAPRQDGAALFADLGGEEAFVQLAHYLYRWYLDEHDIHRFDGDYTRQVWIRRLDMVADPEDQSRYLELVFPATGVMVTLKRTDYRIPELKLEVRSEGYRVTHICRELCKRQVRPGDYAVLDVNVEALYQRLFDARLDARFPDAALLAHLKAGVAGEIQALKERQPASAAAHNTVYYAPIHTVANELWAFWEEGKVLFRFTSDVDLTHEAVWAHHTLNVAIYDTVAQTVVSHEERPGDDRFITRDQVGRALYNCVILGQKTLVPRTP